MPLFPNDWCWFVAGDETRAFSSKAAAYVAVADTAFVDWLASGRVPTPIASEAELAEVLAAYDLELGPLPVPVPESVSRMQLRRQMLTMDRTDGVADSTKLLEQVDAGIAASGDPDLIEYWGQTSDFHRRHPKVEAMLAVFSITDAEADAAWIAASKLT